MGIGRGVYHHHRPRRSRFGWVLLGAALWLALPGVSSAREKKPRQYVIEGLATEVAPDHVTIQGKKGSVTLTTGGDDFTEKVAVGSQVTAYFTPKGDVDELDWLEYSLENFFTPADVIHKSIKKIGFLAHSDVPDADLLIDDIAEYLKANTGWFITPRELADEVWQRASKRLSTLEMIDPATGKVDMAGYVRAQREPLRKVAEITRSDAVLEVNVEKVMASFDGQLAAWDGVEQVMTSRGVQVMQAFAKFPNMGEVPAATVQLNLWDPAGHIMWSNRRGFAVLSLQTGIGNKFRDRPLTEVYQEPQSVQQWILDVFHSLAPVPTPESAAQGKEKDVKK